MPTFIHPRFFCTILVSYLKSQFHPVSHEVLLTKISSFCLSQPRSCRPPGLPFLSTKVRHKIYRQERVQALPFPPSGPKVKSQNRLSHTAGPGLNISQYQAS